MSDTDTRPLSDSERAELEELRREKARRERAELEELRAERASAAPAPARRAPAARPERAPMPAAGPGGPEERTFGQRMVLSDAEDGDGIPTMPPAQKIMIAVCLVAVICAAVYIVTTGGGLAG